MAIVNNANNLALDLRLDEVVPKNSEGEAKSLRSEVEHSIAGNPQGVISELFGSCLSFNGSKDYIEVADTDEIDFGVDEDFTVAVWVNVAASQKDTTNGDNDIVEKWGGDGGYPYVIRYLRNEQTIMAARYDGSNVPQITTTKLQSDKFYHVAFTKQQKQLYLYLDGKLQGSTPDTTQNETKNDSPLYLGRRGGDTANFFTGKLANLRIYSKALSANELQKDIQGDLSAIASFNKVHPIDFKLYEGENRESVIFIENGAQGQELTLEINNNSALSISFPPLTGEPTQPSHHLELRFRPNTLSPAAIEKLTLASNDGWSMSKPITHSKGIVSLYFIAPNSTLPLEPTLLTLQNASGAIEGGSRTTRVELIIPQVSINQSENKNIVNYFREQRLNVISHRGKKNIPLHVGFVNSNKILNDGQTTNSLTLKITNISRDTVIPLQQTSKGDDASKLIVSFDVDTDWALGTKSQVNSIEISGKDWQQNGQPEADWQINKEEQGESPSWTITHNNESAELAPQQVIQLTLNNIISSLPAGNTNLYLRYENIPGYWDGTFICAIEKTPLLVYHSKVGNQQEVGIKFPKDLFGGSGDEAWIKYHNNRDGEKSTLEIAAKNDGDDHIALMPSGNVGIGETNPTAKLDVNGNLHIKGRKPMEFLTFRSEGFSGRRQFPTNYSASNWIAVIGGFNVFNQVGGSISQLMLQPAIENNKWIIEMDIRDSQVRQFKQQYFYISVLFIRREMVNLINHWGI